jgi:hypothetical protein
VARCDHDLVSQIENDALDDSVPLTTVLRKCIVLGGKSGSERLRDWATRELDGYQGGEEELPDYRIIGAPLVMDGIAGNAKITGQQLSSFHLPDFAREHITEELRLGQGVGDLEALLKQADIRLSPPHGAEIAAIMNKESDRPYQYVERIYWTVSSAAVRGVLSHIRNALVKLVAELQANMLDGAEVPSAEVANNAVSVVIHGGKRHKVNLTTAQASGTGTTATANAPTKGDSGSWSIWQEVGAVVGGLAAIAGAVFAGIQAL